MLRQKIIVRTCALALGVFSLVGCNSGNGNTGSAGKSLDENNLNNVRPLFFDSMGVIPVDAAQNSLYILHLNNISDKEYTLESISVSDTGMNNASKSNAFKLVGVSGTMCGTLAAKGSCSIQITPRSGGKSADVLLSAKMRSADGDERVVNQIIRMSRKVGGTGGISFKNDISELVADNGNYGISLPVLLTKDYENIKATNGNLSCNGEGFSKGTSCTLTIRGKALADKTVVATELTGYQNGKVVETVSATSLVRTNDKADLLLSHGAEILADNARVDKTAMISVFNNGGLDASNLEKILSANSKLKLVGGGSDTCGSSLSAGSACYFEVSAASDLNGEDSVTVKYADGATPVVNRLSATNVSYVAQNADIRLEVQSSAGSLENTLVGTTATQTITVTNKGNRNVDKLNFSRPAAIGVSIVPAATNGCGTTLAKTKSCVMEVKYQPTGTQTKNQMLVSISAQYLSGAGTTMLHRQSFLMPYSALDAADINFLSMITEDTADLSISVSRTGAAATASAAYAIKNTSSTSNGYAAKLTSDPKFDKTIAGLAIDNSVADNCKTGAEIAAGKSCAFKVNYGPVTADQAKTEVGLSADYGINGLAGVTKSVSANKFNVTAQTNLAIIQTSVSVSGDGVTGSGTSDDHYKFTALSDKKVKLSYTLKNTGNEAGSLVIKTSYLPTGVEVLSSSTCANGATSALSIAADNSCSLDLLIPKTSMFNNPVDIINPAVTFGQFELPLVYSLDGKDYNGIKQYIDFDRNWAKASYEIDSITSTDTTHLVKIKATINPVSATYPISIKLRDKQAEMLEGATISECSVSQAGEVCMISAEFPRDKYFAGDEVLFDLGALGSGMDPKDTVYGRIAVTIPDDEPLVENNEFKPVALIKAGASPDSGAGLVWPAKRFVPIAGCTDAIEDVLTGLMWEKRPVKDGYTLADAEKVKPANLCGYSDWRLPDINELNSLVEYSQFDQLIAWLATQGFENIQTSSYVNNSGYLSNTITTSPSKKVFMNTVDFSHGEIKRILNKDVKEVYLWHVRVANTNAAGRLAAVSDKATTGIAWPTPRFVAITGTSPQCIVDKLTGLVWLSGTGVVSASGVDDRNIVDQLIATTNNKSLCGYKNWRLPTPVELRSMVNYDESDSEAWLTKFGFNFAGISISSKEIWTESVGDVNWFGSVYYSTSTALEGGDTLPAYIWLVNGESGSPEPK